MGLKTYLRAGSNNVRSKVVESLFTLLGVLFTLICTSFTLICTLFTLIGTLFTLVGATSRLRTNQSELSAYILDRWRLVHARCALWVDNPNGSVRPNGFQNDHFLRLISVEEEVILKFYSAGQQLT